jgi:DNA replication and repair protein RecF
MSKAVDGPAAAPVAKPVKVALTGLKLTDFRNYASLSLDLAAPLIVLTGPNGAGKTNCLEAISLLTPGRGLRRAPYEALVRAGTVAGWALAVDLARDGEAVRIGTGLQALPEGLERGRRIRINGANASADGLLEYLRVLWLTPAMDGLFTGPAGDRRRFLDRLVLAVDPGHGRRVADLEKLLASRNRLLDENGDPALLDAIETQLAEKALAVATARAETIALLTGRIADQAAGGAGFPLATLTLAGDFEARYLGGSASQGEDAYRDALAGDRSRDRAAGRTLEGPHRSDLAVFFTEKAMPAAQSSTGEQKALLIGLILAHAGLVTQVSGMTPILLLDEIAAHLDANRRAALFARLSLLGCQAFLTGTDAALFADAGADMQGFHVQSGEITPA